MRKCKKYKVSHHRSPSGNCESCVYFSKANCGMHGVEEVGVV